MRRIAFFIILLSTAISGFMPCCEEGCAEEEFAVNSETDHKQMDLSCSPFCACATCPCSVEITRIVTFALPTPLIQSHLIYSPRTALPYYARSFWQPPRQA